LTTTSDEEEENRPIEEPSFLTSGPKLPWYEYTKKIMGCEDSQSIREHLNEYHIQQYVQLSKILDHQINAPNEQRLPIFAYLQASLPALYLIGLQTRVTGVKPDSTFRFREIYAMLMNLFSKNPQYSLSSDLYHDRIKYVSAKLKVKNWDSSTNIYDAERALVDARRHTNGLIIPEAMYWKCHDDAFINDPNYWEAFSKQTFLIAKIREEVLKLRFVLVAGVQKVGKTSICNHAFLGDMMGNPNLNTRDVRSWPLGNSKSVFVVDTPACTDMYGAIAVLNALLWRCASVGLIVIDAKRLNENSKDFASFVSRKASCPFAILANQADDLTELPEKEDQAKGENYDAFEALRNGLTMDLENMSDGNTPKEEEVFEALNQKRSEARIYPSKMWFCSASPRVIIPRECISSIDADPYLDMNDYKVMLEQDRILLPRGILALTMELLKESIGEEEGNEEGGGDNRIFLPFQDSSVWRQFAAAQYSKMMKDRKSKAIEIVGRSKVVEWASNPKKKLEEGKNAEKVK